VGWRAIPVPVHYVERGGGTPVLLLHGAGADHREPLGTIEPAFARTPGYRRIYPGHGRTPAPESVQSADDVLAALLDLIDDLIGDEPLLVAGHSAGGYYARAIAQRRAEQVIGLALICPLLEEAREVPGHTAVVQEDLDGDHDAFQGYFVMQTPEMLRSYAEHVAPGVEAADTETLGRIGERWRLTPAAPGRPYSGPVLVVARPPGLGRRVRGAVGSDGGVSAAAGAGVVHERPDAERQPHLEQHRDEQEGRRRPHHHVLGDDLER